jgi:Major Facilitator Superfamily.
MPPGESPQQTPPARRPLRSSLRVRALRHLRDVLDVPRAARRSLQWDVLAGACAGAYTGLAFPFFVRIGRGDLGASDTAIALLAAAPFVGNLFAPLWARQMEGRAKLPFVLVSWIVARTLLLLMPLVTTAGPFILLLFLLQFIGTISTPAYTSMMRDIYPDRARGRLMGYVRVVAQTATFLSTMAAGRLLDHYLSYRTLFPLAGALGIAAAVAFAQVRPLPEAAAHAAAEQRRQMPVGAFVRDTLSILRDHTAYRWFALSVFTYGFGNLMLGPLYALYQIDVLKIANTQIANLANVTALASIAGFLFWGRFMDRQGAPRTVLYGILMMMSITPVYLMHPGVPLLFAAAVFQGLANSCIELSYMQSTLTYAAPGRAAQYQAVHSLLLGVRGVIAPLVSVPLLRVAGFDRIFLLGLAIMAAGAAMQWAATRTDATAAPARSGDDPG